MTRGLVQRPPLGLWSGRARATLGIAIAGTLALLLLDPTLRGLVPRPGGSSVAVEFLSAALRPALSYESGTLPAGAPPFWVEVLGALGSTLVFALGGMSLALVCALPLAFLASPSFYGDAPLRGPWSFVQQSIRTLLVVLRSVHELLWAILFLAAFGLTPLSGVLALAVPYTGVLGRLFADMLDEADGQPAEALQGLGASRVQSQLIGRLPMAAADMASYAFYRFECAVRSSAVLGFFGFHTLGLTLKLSFENLHYREVWTVLYVLMAVVLILDAWSARLRRRFIA